jgi:adenylate kinase family enzyme
MLEEQKEKLEKIAKIDVVINIEVLTDDLLQRITGRRSCPDCGTVYHIIFNPPPEEGKCKCGGDLIQRDDDTEETVRKRLETYQTQTAPLIDYYKKKDPVVITTMKRGACSDEWYLNKIGGFSFNCEVPMYLSSKLQDKTPSNKNYKKVIEEQGNR